MRILLISHVFPPHPATGAARTYSFARTWADAGHHVTVLTTAKRPDHRTRPRDCAGINVVEIDFKPPRLFEALRRFSRGNRMGGESESTNDKTMTRDDQRANASRGPRAWLRKIRDRTGVFGGSRMPDLTDAWVKPAIVWARSQPPFDLIVSSTGPYTTLLVGRRLKRENRGRLFAVDVRDLWARHAVHTGLPPFSWIERRLERKILAEADLVITVSRGLADDLAPRTNAPVHVIYNGFETETRDAGVGWHGQADSFPLAHEDHPSRTTSQDDAPDAAPFFPADHLTRLVFTGTIYPAIHDPAPLLRALARLRKENPAVGQCLRLTVAGLSCEHFARLAARCGVADAVEPLGLIPHDDARRMQRDAHALLLLDAAPPHRGILTSKLFEYLRADAPILVLADQPDSELAALVTRARRGRHLGVDASHIADTLATLVENPAALRATPHHEYIATFDRTVQAKRLLEIVEPMLQSRRRSTRRV